MSWKDIVGGAYFLVILSLSIGIGIKLIRMLAEFFGEDMRDYFDSNKDAKSMTGSALYTGILAGIGIFLGLYHAGCWFKLGLLNCN